MRNKKAKAEQTKASRINKRKKSKIFEANKANQIANVWIQTGIGLAPAWAECYATSDQLRVRLV
jgi:hypothetical protein